MSGPAKLSRPAHAWAFGKRNRPAKTMLDDETLDLAKRKARLLGYSSFAEFMADVVTVNVRGEDAVATLHAERLRMAARIGPVSDPDES